MPEPILYIAGHRGLAGSALVRCFARRPGWRLVTRTHAELELCDRAAVREFFQRERPTHVVLAAELCRKRDLDVVLPARTGTGIGAGDATRRVRDREAREVEHVRAVLARRGPVAP